MSSSDRIRRVKLKFVVATHVRFAIDALPEEARTPESVIRIAGSGLANAGQISRAAFEHALLELESLGELHECRGGFWKDLEKAARYLDLSVLEGRFHSRYRSALKRLAQEEAGDHDQSAG